MVAYQVESDFFRTFNFWSLPRLLEQNVDSLPSVKHFNFSTDFSYYTRLIFKSIFISIQVLKIRPLHCNILVHKMKIADILISIRLPLSVG